MPEKPRILVCPLDWGIGHATRCIPIIAGLQELGAEALIGAGGRPLALLKEAFPGLECIEVPGYDIRYPVKGSMAMSMMRQAPAILKAIRAEHRLLNKLIDAHRINAVISDNRFGMWSDRIPGIYITHQLNIMAPKSFPRAGKLLSAMHRKYIRNFTECWVPDAEEEGLAGKLSHGVDLPVPLHYLGPLSRFSPGQEKAEIVYDLAVIISGPEPQRSIFEENILEQLDETQLRSIVLSGKPEMAGQTSKRGNTTVHSHLSTEKMQGVLRSSKLVICRSGYSSIMDLAILDSRAVLIPTPGQTEQEYLAEYHLQKRHCYTIAQKDLRIEKAIAAARNYSGLSLRPDNEALNKNLKRLISISKKQM